MLICSQVVISEKLIILKFIHDEYKPIEIKNWNNLVETKLLLFAINFIINNLFNHLSC